MESQLVRPCDLHLLISPPIRTCPACDRNRLFLFLFFIFILSYIPSAALNALCMPGRCVAGLHACQRHHHIVVLEAAGRTGRTYRSTSKCRPPRWSKSSIWPGMRRFAPTKPHATQSSRLREIGPQLHLWVEESLDWIEESQVKQREVTDWVETKKRREEWAFGPNQETIFINFFNYNIIYSDPNVSILNS